MPRFATITAGRLAFCLLAIMSTAIAEDQPQWGEQYTRNMVSAEKGLPDTFEPGRRDPRTGEIELPANSGVRWVAQVGNPSHGTPVIAGGRVFVGTTNGAPRDPRMIGDRGVLMCFDEKTGEYLWQLCVPKLSNEKVKWGDWRLIGMTSSPVVEGNRAYLVSNRCEVLCLDVEGMANGNDGPFTDEGRFMTAEGQPTLVPGKKDADILWSFNMIDETKAEPHNGANCSILVDGDLLYVCTANGVEWTHSRVLNPDAPSLVVLDKKTGRWVARDDFGIGPDITHGQWSSPAMAIVGGKKIGYFGAGNGYMYAFEMLDKAAADEAAKSGSPALLKNVWKFHGHPKAQTQDHVPPDHQHDSTSYQLTAMPVVYSNRLYAAFTQESFHGMREGWMTCLDINGQGDTTRTGLVWSYDRLGSNCSTPAIVDGLVYAADFFGGLHCLDAETGKLHWVQRVGGEIWGSPLYADGKIYLGTNRKDLWVMATGKQPKVINRIRMRDPVLSTPVAANGTLYVMTNRHLYAVGK